jgi:hypothetical protein
LVDVVRDEVRIAAPIATRTIASALLLAIRALNMPANFDTGIADPEKPGPTLRSYKLILQLEAIARRAGGMTPQLADDRCAAASAAVGIFSDAHSTDHDRGPP